jgi:hypothetical protein
MGTAALRDRLDRHAPIKRYFPRRDVEVIASWFRYSCVRAGWTAITTPCRLWVPLSVHNRMR